MPLRTFISILNLTALSLVHFCLSACRFIELFFYCILSLKPFWYIIIMWLCIALYLLLANKGAHYLKYPVAYTTCMIFISVWS